MNPYKLLVPKTLWLGTISLLTMLLAWAPFSKAHEVCPANFTATGVEDTYPAKRVPPKKPAKIKTTTQSNAMLSDHAIVEKRKTQPVVRKQNVVSAPNI
ncbi:MAG TPA: hypothetical protein VIX91_03260 [Candidatus Acidoferrum sp.]